MIEFVEVFFVFASYLTLAIAATIIQVFDDGDDLRELEMEMLV